MCGRYVSKDQAAVERAFNVTRGGNDVFEAHFNAAPTLTLPVIRVHRERGRELAGLRWGLVPYWAKDAKMGAGMINARGETIAEKPAFRNAFERRRCLVPMAGFYEWQKGPTGKVPHFIHLLNIDQFAAAGLFEWWPGKDGAAAIESYTIVTTSANEMMAPLHDRMPVILHEQDHAAWLDPKNRDTTSLQELLVPYPSEEMRAYPISTLVNNARNEGPQLLDPA
jgi:putative SOS response-associated peptidase YedK